MKARPLVCVLVHCQGGGGPGAALWASLSRGRHLLGHTAARSPRCLGGRTPSRHSWVRVSETFVCLSFSLLSKVFSAGPPLGLPASPACPSFSVYCPHCFPQADSDVRSAPPTSRGAAARPLRSAQRTPGPRTWGRRVGAGSAASACGRGVVSAACFLRAHGGQGGAEQPCVTRASRRCDGRGLREVNGLPPGT